MTPEEAAAYIENYTWSTTRLGLDRTRELLHAMGDPQKALKFIHVAGSNGKGSTCAMLDSILRKAGYRVGLYTSPYIEEFGERMRVDGENIPGDRLAEITAHVKVIADAMDDHPSQFELVTAIAMEYFREQRCDIVVLEVGMGGAGGQRKRVASGKKVVFLTGVLADKDYPKIMELMTPLAQEFVCLTPLSERALSSTALAAYLTERGAKAKASEDIHGGIREALTAAGEDGVVIAFGSLYLAGAIRGVFELESKL